jgi:hypothetical protein
MKNKNKLSKSTDDLIQGIKVVLSKDRCSLTDEEKNLFRECILRLEASKSLESDDSKQKIELMDILMIVVKILGAASELKDFFN